jgi:hypothetical protein
VKSLDDIGGRIEALRTPSGKAEKAAAELIELGEEVLEHWIAARDEVPTKARREGFRLIALHRQGARGDPAFNACRETCRELAYRYNLIRLDPDHEETPTRLRLAAMVTFHLYLFVTGRMEQAQLGEFCCSSRPLRADAAASAPYETKMAADGFDGCA